MKKLSLAVLVVVCAAAAARAGWNVGSPHDAIKQRAVPAALVVTHRAGRPRDQSCAGRADAISVSRLSSARKRSVLDNQTTT